MGQGQDEREVTELVPGSEIQVLYTLRFTSPYFTPWDRYLPDIMVARGRVSLLKSGDGNARSTSHHAELRALRPIDVFRQY